MQETGELLTTTAELEALGFRKVGDWSLCRSKEDKGGVTCVPRAPAEQYPCVYLVVDESLSTCEVLYVGMGSDGWWHRIRKHLGNWNRPFHSVIAERLRSGADVTTYWKASDWITIHGKRTNLYGAEELALIARFKPRLNAVKDLKRATAWQDA